MNDMETLLKAQRSGKRIVCSIAPYEDRAVQYSPSPGRPSWILDSGQWSPGYRYTAREVHVEDAGAS